MKTLNCFFAFLVSITLVLALSLVSCDVADDDDVDVSEIPELPPLNEMQMETDIFEGGTYSFKEKLRKDEQWYPMPDQRTGKALKKEMNEIFQFIPDEFPAYMVASTLVEAFENHYLSKLNLLNNYFDGWTREEAELADNEFVWSYELEDPETGESVSIRVNAAVTNDQVNWVVIAEADVENGGFEEQQIMEGTTSFDGSTGEWAVTLEIPEDDYSFASTSSWQMRDEQLADLDFDFFLSSGEMYGAVEGKYEHDNDTGRIYDTTIDSPELEEAAEDLPWDIDVTDTFHIEWDFETEAGSITIGEKKFCWDGDKNTVDCP